ncbi:MAG: hypothetical protein IT381_24150 [Deltaproteobacteria bacterium]|nr:hypothetical protein [Deltaproteobacteria bacterium]
MIRLRAQATLTAHGLACDDPARDVVASAVAATERPFSVPAHATLMREIFADKAPRRLDRLSELAIVAAGAAMRAAKLDAFAAERAGVFFATGQGNFSGTMGFLDKLHQKGARLASPIEFPNLVISAPAGSLSFQFGFKGEVFALNQGRLSGLHAVCVAAEALRSRRLDVALVAGAEEHSVGRTRSAELLNRSEVVLGEGAAALILDRAPEGEDDGIRVAGVAMNGLGASDGLVSAAKSCLEQAETAGVELVVTHPRHTHALQKFVAQSGAAIVSLCDRVGELDVRNLIEAAWAAAKIRRGEARRVLVLDADEDSGAAAVLLALGR